MMTYEEAKKLSIEIRKNSIRKKLNKYNPNKFNYSIKNYSVQLIIEVNMVLYIIPNVNKLFKQEINFYNKIKTSNSKI